MTKKRRRPIHLHVMVSEEEQALIQQRMTEAGIRNMGAYMRKMALNGYVLHVDLSPVRELVSLQRRCSNNLNQVAIQANTYGGIYPEEIAALQRDYAALWGPLSDLLKKRCPPMSMRSPLWTIVRHRPPTQSSSSITMGVMPMSDVANCRAAVSPAGPPPMMAAVWWLPWSVVSIWLSIRISL